MKYLLTRNGIIRTICTLLFVPLFVPALFAQNSLTKANIEHALITTDGQVYTKGDIQSMVSIQSVSKVFTMAKVLEEQGPKAVQDKIGVDATGMRFNSIVAVEMQKGKEINPLVNPGAIAASSLVSGADSAAKWRNIVQIQS